MPVSADHAVHLNDVKQPPTICRVISGVERQTSAMSGETWTREQVKVRLRLDGRALTQDMMGEALRPARAEDLHQPGQLVRVPDDESGDAVFLRAGYPNEAVYVESPAADSGERLADIAWVRLTDGTAKKYPYSDIRPAV